MPSRPAQFPVQTPPATYRVQESILQRIFVDAAINDGLTSKAGARTCRHSSFEIRKAVDVTINLPSRRARTFLGLIPLAALVMVFWPARSLRSDNFVFYFPNAAHVVPIQPIGQTNYLPLFQVLNLVGRIKRITAARDWLKVWFEDSELEFHAGDKRIRIKKAKLELSDPVRVENGQWLVPASFLETALPRLIHQTIFHRLGTRRIFIGDVKPISFALRLEPVANGSRLTVQFTEKVNIRTVSSNGKWVVFLGDKPAQPLEPKFSVQDPYVSSVQFDDQDGVPKLVVTPAADGLNFYAKVEETGKTLQADLLKPAPTVAQQPAAPPVPATSPLPSITSMGPSVPGAPQTALSPAELALPAVVLDAGHGGEDAGARGSNGILEKDVAAQLVARVRSTLLASKKYRIVLTRLGDVNPSLDQRDAAANQVRPQVFFSFHAGNLGVRAPRVVVYSYQPSTPSPPLAEDSRGAFIPWDTVQLYQLSRSQQLAQVVQSELAKISGLAVDPPAAAPVRVLRSVNAPAVAIEVGSLAADVDSSLLADLNFQAEIANAIVRAIDIFREGRS